MPIMSSIIIKGHFVSQQSKVRYLLFFFQISISENSMALVSVTTFDSIMDVLTFIGYFLLQSTK